MKNRLNHRILTKDMKYFTLVNAERLHKSIFLSKVLLILDKQLNYIITATIIISHYIIINLSICLISISNAKMFYITTPTIFDCIFRIFFPLNYTSKQSKLIHYIHNTHTHTHTPQQILF